MPLYEYACASCNERLEVRQRFSDAPLTTHDGCGGVLRRILQPVGIVFKGSGWYITDSRPTPSESSSGSSSSDKSSGGSSSSASPAPTTAAAD
ncbi:MAG TPA: FmdB family zinc ribbon protein [Chloroflexota bacterium]